MYGLHVHVGRIGIYHVRLLQVCVLCIYIYTHTYTHVGGGGVPRFVLGCAHTRLPVCSLMQMS